ncbi:MAG: hypothetical protein HDT14_10145 [Oscillibacter sp.]|nr:hypothetical protein [Oscillibacter sp.]
MKKLTAMLLSLVMCLSLMAIPAQAGFTPIPDGSIIIDVGKGPVVPGKGDPNEPGISIQRDHEDTLPGGQDTVPTD